MKIEKGHKTQTNRVDQRRRDSSGDLASSVNLRLISHVHLVRLLELGVEAAV